MEKQLPGYTTHEHGSVVSFDSSMCCYHLSLLLLSKFSCKKKTRTFCSKLSSACLNFKRIRKMYIVTLSHVTWYIKLFSSLISIFLWGAWNKQWKPFNRHILRMITRPNKLHQLGTPTCIRMIIYYLFFFIKLNAVVFLFSLDYCLLLYILLWIIWIIIVIFIYIIRDKLHVFFLEVRIELQDKWLKCNTREI